ncbi:hypothetical protein AKO1_014564 [Acrasis kona]|uniref:Uncharacterized protein n=1 Tax=Acrasis kona TaxID=1008807 RepID=A0AAW2Z373_9EUKA
MINAVFLTTALVSLIVLNVVECEKPPPAPTPPPEPKYYCAIARLGNTDVVWTMNDYQLGECCVKANLETMVLHFPCQRSYKSYKVTTVKHM